MTSTTVEDELKEKRNDYKERMERVRKREAQLRDQRQQLQEKLVQFYKYIQDNEIKRLRATKKANAEQQAKTERFEMMGKLNRRMEDLEREKVASREQYLKYQKYEQYLQEVLTYRESEEYSEASAIIARYKVLEENRNVLKKQKTRLEKTLEESKQQLAVQQARAKNESVELQNALNELQGQYEALQRAYKKRQDELEQSVSHKSTTTKEIGQVRMACQNLYDRCQAVNAQYKGRVARDEGEDDMQQQLQAIGDCLQDYVSIRDDWKRRQKAGRPEEPAERTTRPAGSASPANGDTAAGDRPKADTVNGKNPTPQKPAGPKPNATR